MIALRNILNTWGRVLTGRHPVLSIEVTRECPLRCPGCYAFDPAHLGDHGPLRSLHDFKGNELVSRVLALVDQAAPLHVSLVGGDPLVRYREMELLVPQLLDRGIFVQLVTSAFRPPAAEWRRLPNFELVVSIDGLAPEHDRRRAPATYERILHNIEGHQVTVHCTLTRETAEPPGYLEEFVRFWSQRPTTKRIWFSLLTPQRGGDLTDVPNADLRADIVRELRRLRRLYPKLDMPEGLLAEFLAPPTSPADCLFARLTRVVTADLQTEVHPCQFGGDPDCSRCGCYPSMGLAALANYQPLPRLLPGLRLRPFIQASYWVGAHWASAPLPRRRPALAATPAPPQPPLVTIAAAAPPPQAPSAARRGVSP